MTWDVSRSAVPTNFCAVSVAAREAFSSPFNCNLNLARAARAEKSCVEHVL